MFSGAVRGVGEAPREDFDGGGCVRGTDVTAALFRWAAGIPDAVMLAVALVVGGVAVAHLVRTGYRRTGEMRRAWLCIAATCLVWSASNVALLLGVPAFLYWNLFRPVALATLIVGILSFPGVIRPPRDLVQAVLDGWVTVGGVFVVVWMHLHLPSLQPLSHSAGGWHWVVADQIVLSTVGGMMARASSRHRRPLAFLLAVGTLGAIGHLVFAITGNVQLTVLFWSASVCGIAFTPRLTPDGDLFSNAFADPEQRRVIRMSQLPLLPTVYYMLSPHQADWVATGVGLSVITIIFLTVTSHSRENAALLGTVREQSTRFRELLSDSRDAIVQLDAVGRVEYANEAVEAVLGHRTDEMIARPWTDFVHPVDAGRVQEELAAHSAEGTPSTPVEARVRHGDGRMVHTESTVTRRGQSGGWVLTTRDITDRVRLRDELAAQARTDALTGLLNRAAFLALADERLAGERPAIVLFVDLDQFKGVNDTLGHATGDELLCDVAARLRTAVGPGDAVARLGGDEFAVLTRTSDLHRAKATAAAVVDAVARLESPGGGRTQGASVGIAEGHGISAVQLLREADLAMYRAKARGGSCAVVFEPWMSERVLERSHLRRRLETAVRDGGLLIELQPVVHLATRGWSGFEALVRWQDGDRRRGPGDFLPLAEESGLIVPVGTWVLWEALRQLAVWPDPHAGVAVNVSPRQLEENGFAALVEVALEASGIAPERLTLEITEQTAVDDLGRTASRLAPLRDSGVHVAVDDFGTGFSSMRYLTRLPVDALKIDRQFVDGLGVRPRDEVLVVSMLRLAADLGLDVVAEGVETTQQADILLGHGCGLAQGYLFSPPRELADLRRLHDGTAPVPAQRRSPAEVAAYDI
jgi:diguanylate cyclase (GGDEF)-like protein/PAS domain S-box-containing protein